MKRLLALPVIWLILGTVAIATEIRTNDPLPARQQLSGVILSCVATALDTRDTAVIAAVTAFQNGNLAALNTRKTALLAAWTKTTKSELKSAISAAWKIYQASMKDLKKVNDTAKKSAWSVFVAAVKVCKGASLLQSVDTTSVNNE